MFTSNREFVFLSEAYTSSYDKVYIKDIYMIDSNNNDIRIYVSNRQPNLRHTRLYQLRMTLTDIGKLLPDCFIRVHRRSIVNIHYIVSFSKTQITLNKNNFSVAVGPTYRDTLKSMLPTFENLKNHLGEVGEKKYKESFGCLSYEPTLLPSKMKII